MDTDQDDPSAGVDAQVRAIWTALVNEYRLQYINPPPAYSTRDPAPAHARAISSMSNTGTCIDLALLLASCLEYIDIYPVIVLLTRPRLRRLLAIGQEAHDEFATVKAIPANDPGRRKP